MKIFASVVLYNPQKDLLKKNIAAVSRQVDGLIIVDNHSANKSEIEDCLQSLKKEGNLPEQFFLIWNDENKGIAAALNQALQQCLKSSAQWLLTLDQDSVIPVNMIKNYKQYMNLENVGQLSCVFYNPDDPEYTYTSISNDTPWTEMTECITSGCLMNVAVSKKIGFFDERLFIDDVDYEYSLRMRRAGYRVYGISSIRMEHHLGNSVNKSFMGIHYVDYNYSPMRVYYQARNGMYMLRNYPEEKRSFSTTLLHCFVTSLLGKRWDSVKAFLRAVKDSKKMKRWQQDGE